GHSLKATILVSKIHRKLNMLISLAEFFQAPTIRRLAQNFETEEKAVSSTKDKHIIQLRSGTDKNKHLFFIHDGTGEVEGYLELCKHLHKSFNCWGLKADRLQKGAPGNITIPDIAGTYISRIKKIQPRGPYSIVGWSLGGVVAFEIVRELEQLGEETGFFAMVDSRFRGEKAGKRDREPWEFSIQTELELIRKSFPEIDMDKMERLKETPDLEQLWAFVIRYIESEIDIRQIRKLVSTQLFRGLRNYDNMTAEELVNYYNLLRTLVRADSFYRSPNKIDTQMYYFAALQSKGTKRKQWKTYCTKPVKNFEIPGDHFSIFQQPGVRELAKVFNRILVSTE
ncbi:MAG: non-ribosomal peptide synthetase, partial [bacterium]|nr:non-ribosomal peptide synthetase [bacterium]